MADKFQNKYRIPSARLPNWDYGWNAAYFVTICTKDRYHYFGEITNNVMNFSNVGIIADVMWYEIKNHAKNIDLGAFVVMPNHVHGIIILNGDDNTNAKGNIANVVNDNDIGNGNNNGIDNRIGNRIDNGIDNVETRHALSLQTQTPQIPQTPSTPPIESMQPTESIEPIGSTQPPNQPQSEKTITQQRFQNQGKNTLSSIVGGYKSAVTKHANRLQLNFAWQPRFYEHIIRDEKSFQHITAYITNNITNWSGDQFFK